MRKLISTLMIAVVLASPAAAHHGWSSYDASKVIKASGAALSVKWENPHAEITLSHEGATWIVVLAPLSRLEARGLPKEALPVGKSVQVEAYPKRDGEKEMRAERIIVDGKTVELR